MRFNDAMCHCSVKTNVRRERFVQCVDRVSKHGFQMSSSHGYPW